MRQVLHKWTCFFKLYASIRKIYCANTTWFYTSAYTIGTLGHISLITRMKYKKVFQTSIGNFLFGKLFKVIIRNCFCFSIFPYFSGKHIFWESIRNFFVKHYKLIFWVSIKNFSLCRKLVLSNRHTFFLSFKRWFFGYNNKKFFLWVEKKNLSENFFVWVWQVAAV